MSNIPRRRSGMINSILTKDRTRLHYFCSLIEYTARKTHNKRSAIISHMTNEDIEHEFHVALTNACLSFEQVSDELIDYLGIRDGDCEYDEDIDFIYDFLTIGSLLQTCIIAYVENGDMGLIPAIREVVSNSINDTLKNVN